jgi:hypothetical protein
MSVKLPDGNITCPHTWHEKKCRDLAMNCPKFIQVMGTHPQTGDPVSEWGCSDTFLPMLMIENSQQQRQTGAAVESFRNEMVQANAVSQQVLMAAAGINSKLIEGA